MHLHRPSSAVCHACFATAREAGRSTVCGWHGGGIKVKEDGLSHVCRLEEELVAVDLLSWLLIGAPANGLCGVAKIDGEAACCYWGCAARLMENKKRR